jgi:hypothetical protein
MIPSHTRHAIFTKFSQFHLFIANELHSAICLEWGGYPISRGAHLGLENRKDFTKYDGYVLSGREAKAGRPGLRLPAGPEL